MKRTRCNCVNSNDRYISCTIKFCEEAMFSVYANQGPFVRYTKNTYKGEIWVDKEDYKIYWVINSTLVPALCTYTLTSLLFCYVCIFAIKSGYGFCLRQCSLLQRSCEGILGLINGRVIDRYNYHYMVFVTNFQNV